MLRPRRIAVKLERYRTSWPKVIKNLFSIKTISPSLRMTMARLTESTVLSVRFVIVPVTKLWLPGCSVTLPISKSVVRGTCFRFTDVKLSQLG